MHDMDKYINEMSLFAESLAKNPIKAKEFLIKTEIYNSDGSLSKNYGGEK